MTLEEAKNKFKPGAKVTLTGLWKDYEERHGQGTVVKVEQISETAVTLMHSDGFTNGYYVDHIDFINGKVGMLEDPLDYVDRVIKELETEGVCAL
jgi:hypothetical protein